MSALNFRNQRNWVGLPTTTFIFYFSLAFVFRTNATQEENLQAIIDDSIAYFILSLISTAWQFVFGIICVDCFNRTAIRQVTRIRIKYFESLMRQNIGWYDIAAGKTNFSIRITEYVVSSALN